ncbi:SCO7613 C-terminal domain-containing membrane protein [Streptomyces sp. NPDC091280]|uniref:SCO7613 C-terminal domain-containing membrane protein n=1 Tax=Streptomyces sp. NPDC091280 TaxID=3365984 RepID=UPI0038164E1A
MSYGVTGTTLRVMTHFPPPAMELRLLDAELRQLDARRAQLLHRRAWLLTMTQPVRSAPVPPPLPFAPPRREATAPGVQNLLLLLGGILLTLAATAFTLVSWGSMGIAGRALVLGAVTVAALGTPVALLRRGLRSTAESIAGIGLVLTVLDAYALHEVAFADADGALFAAAATTVLAALWAVYGIGTAALPNPAGARPADSTAPGTAPASPTLSLPLPAALVVAQLTLVLWVIAAGGGKHTITAAVLLTAVIDMMIALRAVPKAVRVVAVGGALAMGGWGVLATGLISLIAAGPGAAARAAALLALAAAGAFGAAWLVPGPALRTASATVGGLLVVAALGGLLRVPLPFDWTVLGYLACGIGLLALVRGRLPEPVRRGLGLASAVVQAVALLWTLPAVVTTLFGPLAWVSRIWSGAPDDARTAATVDIGWPAHQSTVPLALMAVAAVLAGTVRNATWRPRALAGALTLTWLTATIVPATLQLPYAMSLLTQALVAVALLLLTHRTATVLALLASLCLTTLSLASQTATLAVLASLTALLAMAAWRGRLPRVTVVFSLGYATALACAVGASLAWQPQHAALLVLLVPVAAALLAARLTDPVTTVVVEVSGAVAGVLAIGLAGAELPMLALVLALCGVIVAGTAVRPERRNLGYVAAALFVLASWVRLGTWNVVDPEAYTLPVTVPALFVGALRRRRDPNATSWTAYGPGLAVTLAPSLLAAWTDPHWTRPLLLGTAALALTLLGARHRLQAPLVLGATTLALDALHELAPYLAQVVGALPRWAPPALAGLLLLAVGATYEQRIRDARRVREVLGRMN